jgi:hypothetical protein
MGLVPWSLLFKYSSAEVLTRNSTRPGHVAKALFGLLFANGRSIRINDGQEPTDRENPLRNHLM